MYGEMSLGHILESFQCSRFVVWSLGWCYLDSSGSFMHNFFVFCNNRYEIDEVYCPHFPIQEIRAYGG